jgi:Fungal cellulose binding domain
VLKLLNLRDELISRGLGYLLKTWTCPSASIVDCNPCGRFSGDDSSWGYLNGGGGWEHIACRTYDITGDEFPGLWHDGQNVSRTGVVTTIHLTDLGIEGTLESAKAAFCPFVHLRELDMDGSHYTGSIPSWIGDCFPHLKELDLSHGRLSGTIGDWVAKIGSGLLEQFKIEGNSVTGTIPAIMATMPALRVLWAAHNDLVGVIPDAFVRQKSIMSLDVRYNPRLCGPLPPIKIDWVWQFTHKYTTQEVAGFCDKAATEATACGVLASMGTQVGRSCDRINSGSKQCGAAYDQCGGAPSPRMYKGKVVGYDTWNGPRCCEAGSYCNQANPYFFQCTPNSLADHAYDGQTDLGIMPRNPAKCATNMAACGGAKGLYDGPTGCCSPRDRCIYLNSYLSMCLTPGDQETKIRASQAWS